MDTKIIAGGLAAVIVVAGAAFYAGMQYAQASRAARFSQGQNAQFQGSPGGRNGTRFTGGAAFGTILSKDTQGITIQLSAPGQNPATNSQGTGSKIILLSNSTQITKSASGSTDDLTTGSSVMIQGTENSDGSITAQTIQLRPSMLKAN